MDAIFMDGLDWLMDEEMDGYCHMDGLMAAQMDMDESMMLRKALSVRLTSCEY